MTTNNGTDFGGVDGVPGNIGATFAATIEPALSGNSPQQVAFYTGAMLPDPSAPGPVVLPGFDVNRKVRKLILSLSFSERFETPQLANLLGNIRVTKDGADVTGKFQPILVGNFSSSATLVADFQNMEQPIAPDGNYVVSLTLPQGFKPDLHYRLVPYVDDHRLDIESALSPSVKRVNQPIEVAVRAAWLNQGIETATVVVRAFGPGADMGEALSPGAPVDPAGGEDAGNAGIQKYDQLAANDPAFLAQLKLSPNALTMTHQGGGLYTGSYPAPDIVGVVHFLYNLSIDTPEFGRVQRTWYESAYARLDGVDMEGSTPTFTPPADGLMRLDFTPVRPSGKRVGPGYLSAIRFTGVTLAGGKDNQDGSYSFTVTGGDANTPIEVTLLGDPIYSGPANWGDGAGQGGLIDFLLNLPWWFVLLILVIVVVILIVRLRGSNP
jgi:hypothetical protein